MLIPIGDYIFIHFDFDVEHTKKEVRKLKSSVDILEISTKDEKSIKSFILWIEFKRNIRV